MSLSIILITKDSIIMTADSRGGLMNDGIYYQVNDNFRKIWQIEDKVVFTCGSSMSIEKAITQYILSPDKSMTTLQQICINTILTEEEAINLTVGMFEDGVPVVYNIDSLNEFKISRKTKTNTDLITIGGVGSSGQVASQMASIIAQQNNCISFRDIQDIYKSLSSEQIGGTLTVYTITNDTISASQVLIEDNRPIRSIMELLQNQNIHCSYGSISWDKVNSDPSISTAQNTANTANGTANTAKTIAEQIAKGEYTGGTFIDGKNIYSPSIKGGNITIGTGNSIFKADSNGIYLGSGAYASAPFKVSPEGNLIATNARISGTITGSTITGSTITGSTISVDTNMRIGDKLKLSGSNPNAGIQFGDDNDINAEIFVDCGGKLMDIIAPGGVYVNNVEIGKPLTAKFG